MIVTVIPKSWSVEKLSKKNKRAKDNKIIDTGRSGIWNWFQLAALPSSLFCLLSLYNEKSNPDDESGIPSLSKRVKTSTSNLFTGGSIDASCLDNNAVKLACKLSSHCFSSESHWSKHDKVFSLVDPNIVVALPFNSPHY